MPRRALCWGRSAWAALAACVLRNCLWMRAMAPIGAFAPTLTKQQRHPCVGVGRLLLTMWACGERCAHVRWAARSCIRPSTRTGAPAPAALPQSPALSPDRHMSHTTSKRHLLHPPHWGSCRRLHPMPKPHPSAHRPFPPPAPLAGLRSLQGVHRQPCVCVCDKVLLVSCPLRLLSARPGLRALLPVLPIPIPRPHRRHV